jgi:hypothetical protein
MRRVSSLLAAFVALVALAGRASADDEEAQPAEPSQSEALDRALQDLKAGRYEAACPALQQIVRQDPRPKTLFHLADCEEKSGRIATAAVLYDDYQAMFDRLSASERDAEREREETAAAHREALEKRIPRVILRLPRDAPGSTTVTRASEGGKSVQLAVGVPLPLDPGKHTVRVEVPGRPPMDKSFTIKESENKIVELEVAPASTSLEPTRRAAPLQPVPTLLPPLDPGIPPRRVIAYALGGVGVVGVLGGAVTGAITWAQKGPIALNCQGRICNETGVHAKDTARVSGLISTIAFPVGLAALGAGLIVYVTEPPPSKFGNMAPRVRVGAAVGAGDAALEVDVRW